MSRQLRAGTASKPWAFRITEAERELWQAAADAIGSPSLSAAVRPAITQWAIGVVELKLPPGRKKTRLLAIRKILDRLIAGGAPSK
jgi:hypothetical protein